MTFVEECDFTGVDLKQLVPLVLRATAASLQGVPGAERPPRGRRDRLPRALRLGVAVQTEQGLVVPVVRGCDAASLDGAGGRGRAARRRRTRRNAEAGGAARRHVHGHERRQARRPLRHAARQPPRGRHPRHPPDRPAPRRPRRRDRRSPHRQRLGHLRPSRRRRGAGGGVHAGRDRAPRVRPLPPSRRPPSMVVCAEAPVVELRADLAAGPLGRVDVRVRVPGPHRREDLGEVAGLDPWPSRGAPTWRQARSRPPPRCRPRRCRTAGSPGSGRAGGGFRGAAQEERDAAVDAGFPKCTCDCWTFPSSPE